MRVPVDWHVTPPEELVTGSELEILFQCGSRRCLRHVEVVEPSNMPNQYEIAWAGKTIKLSDSLPPQQQWTAVAAWGARERQQQYRR